MEAHLVAITSVRDSQQSEERSISVQPTTSYSISQSASTSFATLSSRANPDLSTSQIIRSPSEPLRRSVTTAISVIKSDAESDRSLWGQVSEIRDEDLVNLDDGNSSLARASSVQISQYQDEAKTVLSERFGLQSFRHHQLEAITATMEGKDVFVLMPTGGGKSLCFQVPAVCQGGKTRGVTVVVSPLIALMSNQVKKLQSQGIEVIFFRMGQNLDDARRFKSLLVSPNRKPHLCFVTPERLANDDNFKSLLTRLVQSNQLARFVIDEAHCITMWGRNFRSDVWILTFFAASTFH